MGITLLDAAQIAHEIILPVVPSLAGALTSLQFLGNGLPLRHKIYSVLVGVICAAYIAPVVITWFGVRGAEMYASLQFLIALFALAIGREIFREIESGLIQRIRSIFLGGRDK